MVAALESTDEKVRSISVGLTSDGTVWAYIDSIENAEGKPEPVVNKEDEVFYRRYDIPDFQSGDVFGGL